MIQYKLSKEIPAIYPRLREVFGVEWKNIVIAYSDTIHCIDDLPMNTIVHDVTHLEQQKEMGPEAWWNKYIDDPVFRLNQEVEAYRNQIAYLENHEDGMSNNHKRQWIDRLALDLSGPMYGNIIDYQDAVKLLKI